MAVVLGALQIDLISERERAILLLFVIHGDFRYSCISFFSSFVLSNRGIRPFNYRGVPVEKICGRFGIAPFHTSLLQTCSSCLSQIYVFSLIHIHNMKYVGGKLNYFNAVLLLRFGNFKHEIYLSFSIL